MSIRKTLAALLLTAAVAAPAFAQAPAAPPTRIRGTVAAIDGRNLTVTSRDGSTIKVMLAEDYAVVGLKKIEMSEIKQGSFIGTAAQPAADGTLQSLEVLVFPEAMRGSGEGHYDWDLAPGTSMTNATVTATVEASAGRTLDLAYKGGSIKITVPPNAPIVTFTGAEKSELKPGAKIFLAATKAADGSFTAARVTVGKDGLTPPM